MTRAERNPPSIARRGEDVQAAAAIETRGRFASGSRAAGAVKGL